LTKTTLLHGDCSFLMKDIISDSVDCIITDVPYGINYKSNRQGIDRADSISKRKDTVVREKYFTEIKNDENVPIEWLHDAYRILKNNMAIYIFIHWSTWSELEQGVKDAGFKVKNMIVINKSNHGMGDLKGDYAPKHELVLYATKGKHKLNFFNGRKNNVMDLPVKFSGAKRLHPNEKPVSWAEAFLVESTRENEVVLDPFMGSGFVGKACKKNNRNFIGIELDKKYYDIASETI